MSQVADIIADYYRGTLISEILKMPRKEPISFDEAIRLNHENQQKAFGNTEEYLAFYECFVRNVSESGFHIDLTGDEFEVILRSTKDC